MLQNRVYPYIIYKNIHGFDVATCNRKLCIIIHTVSSPNYARHTYGTAFVQFYHLYVYVILYFIQYLINVST